MRKGFSLAMILAVLSGLTATAQIPRTLQIGVTNGTVTVFTQNSPGYFGAQFESTTNLSPPIVWTANPTNWESGEIDNLPATNSQEFFRLWQSWPIFQLAIFYNLNMEIDPGQAMNINGPVFCNASIWAEGSAGLTFNSTVVTVGQVFTNTTDPFATGYAGSGAPTFAISGQPVSGSESLLNLPIFGNKNLTNAEAFLNLPPAGFGAPNVAAYADSNQVYLFNESDIVISNASWGT